MTKGVLQRRHFLDGIPLSPVTMADTLSYVEKLIHQGASGNYLIFCEANLLSHIPYHEKLAESLRNADLVLADGIATATLTHLRGIQIPERLPGPSFLPAACEYGVPRGWRHFFLGGKEGTAQKLARRMQERFPGLQVAGTYAPPFRTLSSEEEQEMKAMIEEADTHVLWVALGSPKQELWVAEHAQCINVPVMLPVGAAFDFHAGTRPWAPAGLRKRGLEWLFRTITGGKSTFRRNVRCVSVVGGMLLIECLKYPFRRCGRKSDWS